MILSILVIAGLVYHVGSVLTRAFSPDQNINALQVLPGLTVTAALSLAYITLLKTKKFSRVWAWGTFGLLIVTIVIISQS